jgi:hypothetical protein
MSKERIKKGSRSKEEAKKWILGKVILCSQCGV